MSEQDVFNTVLHQLAHQTSVNNEMGQDSEHISLKCWVHWDENLNLTHCVCVLCVFSCVRLFATPWTVAHQTSLSMEFSKQEYWSGLPFPIPGALPDPGAESTTLASPALAGGFFTISVVFDYRTHCFMPARETSHIVLLDKEWVWKDRSLPSWLWICGVIFR